MPSLADELFGEAGAPLLSEHLADRDARGNFELVVISDNNLETQEVKAVIGPEPTRVEAIGGDRKRRAIIISLFLGDGEHELRGEPRLTSIITMRGMQWAIESIESKTDYMATVVCVGERRINDRGPNLTR